MTSSENNPLFSMITISMMFFITIMGRQKRAIQVSCLANDWDVFESVVGEKQVV